MSVLVKGMEMPKPGAYTCELGVLDDNTAVLTIYTPINEPQKSYTLIPVPPHGRLIDVDKLEEEVCCGCKRGCIDCAIANAPTVIPADKDGET